MKNTQVQIQRRVDELGRVVIPMEMRQYLGIQERDLMNIRLDSKKVVLEKAPQEEQQNNTLQSIIVSNEILETLGAKDTSELKINIEGKQVTLEKI